MVACYTYVQPNLSLELVRLLPKRCKKLLFVVRQKCDYCLWTLSLSINNNLFYDTGEQVFLSRTHEKYNSG